MDLVHAFLFCLPEDHVVRANGRKHLFNFTISHKYMFHHSLWLGVHLLSWPISSRFLFKAAAMTLLSPFSPTAEFHPLTVPALRQDMHIHHFPNLSPRVRLQKIDQPCLWIEPGSLGCLFALHSNPKAPTPSESPGAWPGGHNRSRACGRGCVTS